MPEEQQGKKRVVPDPELRGRIEATYVARRNVAGIKTGSARDLKAQAEFFSGALAALIAQSEEEVAISPYWAVMIMSGRTIC